MENFDDFPETGSSLISAQRQPLGDKQGPEVLNPGFIPGTSPGGGHGSFCYYFCSLVTFLFTEVATVNWFAWKVSVFVTKCPRSFMSNANCK